MTKSELPGAPHTDALVVRYRGASRIRNQKYRGTSLIRNKRVPGAPHVEALEGLVTCCLSLTSLRRGMAPVSKVEEQAPWRRGASGEGRERETRGYEPPSGEG